MFTARKTIAAIGVVALGGTLLAACSSSATPTSSTQLVDDGTCTTLTVLTNRTAEVDGIFKDYAATFEKDHPGVTVEFQSIQGDYDGTVRTRLNTKDYGDVLNIPLSVSPTQYPQFFAPLGAQADLSKKYYFADSSSAKGLTYGISQTASPGGYIVNSRVWAEAGITEPPKTPDEFLDALKAIKEETGATPLYTNYKDGWPLQMWENFVGLTNGPDSMNELLTDPAPWKKGSDHYVADSLLYDAVADGLTEADPTTTDWNASQALVASGKVATMIMPAFAVPLIQGAASSAGANPADIAFWPLPIVNSDGDYQALLRPEYNLGVNKNSKCQATGRDWIEFFVGETDFAANQGAFSTLKSAAAPASLEGFRDLGVTYVETTPEKAGTEGTLAGVEKEAGLDFIADPTYRRDLIDIARGAKDGDKQSYFDELNKRWADAVSTVVG